MLKPHILIPILIISILFLYLSINNENSIIYSIIKIYNNNNNNELSTTIVGDELDINYKKEIKFDEEIKKYSIFEYYPKRFKNQLIKLQQQQQQQQQIEKEKEEFVKQKQQENQKQNEQNEFNIILNNLNENLIIYSSIFIIVSFLFIIIGNFIIKNQNQQNNKTINLINKEIESIDKDLNSIIPEPLLEINKMKTIYNPYVLGILLLDFKKKYTDEIYSNEDQDNNNSSSNSSNSIISSSNSISQTTTTTTPTTTPNYILLEYKNGIEILDNRLKEMTDIIQVLSGSGDNKKLLKEKEIFKSKKNKDSNNNNSSNDNDSSQQKYDQNFDILPPEVRPKMFMYLYKKYDMQKEKAFEEAELIKKENERQFKENEKIKKEQEKKKREYQESIEEIRESKFILFTIKLIVILNILPEFMKLIFFHLNSLIPTKVCLNLNNNTTTSYRILKQILNNTPFGNLIENNCLPIGFKFNLNLIIMTIAYLIILIICLTVNTNSYIISFLLLAITFYSYKIDYSNLNAYLFHLIINLLLLFLWKLFLNHNHELMIKKYNKWFISPSILSRIITLTIIILYNYLIHKYLLNSINLIITI